MKKILLMLSIILCLPCSAEDILFLDKERDEKASAILDEYYLKRLNHMKPEEVYKEFNYTKSDVRAVFYDLNSDGIDEVIGYINSSAFQCVEGYQLFILKNEPEGYMNIVNVNFYPNLGVKIANSKTDNFFDIGIYFTKINLVEKPALRISKDYDEYAEIKYNKKYRQY